MEDMDSMADRLINEVCTHIAVDSARLYAASQEVELLWARLTVFMFAVFAVFASAGVVFALFIQRGSSAVGSSASGALRLASGNLTSCGYRTKDEVEALWQAVQHRWLKGSRAFTRGLNKR